MQRRELAGAEDAERFEDLRSDLVLSTVAARGRGERGAISLPAIEHHQQPVVLVVGVRRGVHEHAGIGEMPQDKSERDVPLFVVEGNDAHLSGGKGDKRREDDEKPRG